MVDIKNFVKKFEGEKFRKIEKIAETGKEVKEGGVEKAPEKIIEVGKTPEVLKVKDGERGAETSAGLTIGQRVIQKRKEREKQVENILSKNMEEAYLGMSQAKQQEFKRQGEKTAQKISSLLEKTKVKVKNIISLIKKWISIIPGINKFFLEQESKIKADEVMKLKDR